jgi:hypothetical protein
MPRIWCVAVCSVVPTRKLIVSSEGRSEPFGIAGTWEKLEGTATAPSSSRELDRPLNRRRRHLGAGRRGRASFHDEDHTTESRCCSVHPPGRRNRRAMSWHVRPNASAQPSTRTTPWMPMFQRAANTGLGPSSVCPHPVGFGVGRRRVR